ncbi:MAG: ribosome small subunit-dependent GTPase A [Nitrospiraceae bacterium]|nr:ribosome small subunit-dependent GTPase A [Nitrospiraceae bacterium]
MELNTLGFDQWFEDRKSEARRPDCSVARVTAVHRDSFLVRNEQREIFAEPAGGFLYAAESSMDLPSVGDWVLVQYHNDDTLAIIHGLLPRKTFLRRKTAGKKVDYQMIAANIDCALIVQACDADFSPRRLERYLVMVNEGNIEPILLLTKTDLILPEMLEQRMSVARRASGGCRILALSNVTGFGVDLVRQLLEPGRTYCLVGSSGVGKTTLLNLLIGGEVYETNAVRPSDGKGRHTTTSRQLIVLDHGAMLIDTPGMRELGNIGADAGLEESFSDIWSLAKSCRFANCTHTQEAGCALLAAVESGAVQKERYESYLKLLKESAYNEMSYSEKRLKDKAFGKFVKTVTKDLKKFTS